jgi:hypothetical protein
VVRRRAKGKGRSRMTVMRDRHGPVGMRSG